MSKFLAFAFLISYSLFAQEIRLGTPVYAGDGCPQSTISFSPNMGEISFSNFKLDHNGRIHCDIAIPVQIPKGYSVAIGPVMVKGQLSLRQDSLAKIYIESFWAGSREPTQTHQWSGPIMRGFEIPTAPDTSSSNWSPCGNDINLRVHASISLSTVHAESNLIEISSIAPPQGISSLIRWKRC